MSKERGEGIAREHNISFLETSAKVIHRLVDYYFCISPFADEHQHREGIPWAGRGDLGQEQRTRDEACVGPFEPACPAWRLSWVLPVACYKDGCQQFLEGDHSPIRPWLKKCPRYLQRPSGLLFSLLEFENLPLLVLSISVVCLLRLWCLDHCGCILNMHLCYSTTLCFPC